MTALIVVAVVAVFLLVIGGIVAGIVAAKKRREALQAYAASKGLAYTRRDNRWVHQFSGSPFGLGHSREATNVLDGPYDGRRMVAFDYVYYTTETSSSGNGGTSTHEEAHRFGVVALAVGGADGVPDLHVYPEGFFGRAIGHLTGHDIELESEDFNRAFTVHCSDRKFASDVLQPRLMQSLLAGFRDVDWRFDGQWLLTVHHGNHKIEGIEHSLAAADTILDSLPAFVREDHGLSGPTA